MNKEANIKEVSKLYEYNLSLGNLLFINREAIYKLKSINCSKPGYINITWVAIQFIPYDLIFG